MLGLRKARSDGEGALHKKAGPFMPATLLTEEMEYTTKVKVLKKLKPRMEEID